MSRPKRGVPASMRSVSSALWPTGRAPAATTRVGGRHDPHLGLACLGGPADEPDIDAGDRGSHARPRRFRRRSAGELAHEPGRRRAGDEQKAVGATDVLEADLLREKVLVELLVDGGGHAGRGHQHDAVVEHPHEQGRLHLAVNVEQGGGASLSRRQRLDLVAQQRVKKAGAVAAGGLDQTAVAPIDQARAPAHGTVLGGRVAVVERNVARGRFGHGVILHVPHVLDCAACRDPRGPSS